MVLLNDVKNSNKTTIIIHGVSSKYQTQMEKLVKKGLKNGLNALDSGVLPGYGLMYLFMADKTGLADGGLWFSYCRGCARNSPVSSIITG